jgi:acetyl-CoA decarbonylase/synthase complex subunit gamma
MALSGLQIQKLLPKTNCKECGSNTCLAFAMKLAGKKAELKECPYASEEAKQVLGAASEPPVKGIALGAGRELKLGEETVLYRHEKTFVHQTALGVNINDTDAPAAIEATLEALKSYTLVRVGQTLAIDVCAVTQRGQDAQAFMALAARAWQTTHKPLVLRSPDTKALAAAAAAVVGEGGSHSVICCPKPEAAAELAAVAKEHGHALALTAPDLDALAATAEAVKQSGFNDLILEFQTHSLAEEFQSNSIARRAALQESFKAFGYPTLHMVESTDLLDSTVEASTEIAKYGGICVLPSFDAAQMSTLLTLRLNLYTDPQKPIQVEPKLYPIGEPTADSPVFVTTNFSLTYFIVSGEIENSGLSAWLLVPECEGLSVLTAWAAGKFSGASIGKFAKENGLETQVQRRDIIIPGYVAQISGELEESLPGWRVLVGPQEAADLESFIKTRLT